MQRDLPIAEAVSPAAGWIRYSLKKPYMTLPAADMAKPYTWRWIRCSGWTVPSLLLRFALAYNQSDRRPITIEKTRRQMPVMNDIISIRLSASMVNRDMDDQSEISIMDLPGAK